MSKDSGDPRLEAFVAERSLDGTLGKKSAMEYHSDILRFARFLEKSRTSGPYHNMYEATDTNISVYLHSLANEGLSIVSVRRKYAALRAFFQYQLHKGLRKDDPTDKIKLPKVTRVVRPILQRDEMQRLLAAPNDEEHGLRDRAVLFAYYSGIKRAELPEIEYSSFDVGKQQFTVQGRTIPLTKEAAEAIDAYVAVRPRTKQKALFITNAEQPLGVRQAWMVVKKAARSCGLEDKTSPETLRGSYTVHALQDSVPILDVMEVLGSRDLNTIIHYVRMAHVSSSLGDLVDGGISDATFDALDMRSAKMAWSKIEKQLHSEPESAITGTRTLLESVCKRILKEHGISPGTDDNLSSLCKRAVTLVLPEDLPENEHFIKFARIAAGLVEHISLYRNLRGDAHGSAESQAVAKYEAEYAVNLARATATFLVQSFRVKRAALSGDVPSPERREFSLDVSEKERAAFVDVVGKMAKRERETDRLQVIEELKRRASPKKARANGAASTYVTLTLTEARLVLAAIPLTISGAQKRLAQMI